MNTRRSFAAALFAILVVVSGVSAARPASRPPSYEIPAIPNGCHISTLAYLHRFRADHPAERATDVRILRRNDSGCEVSHNIALFSWENSWWCRDDVLGFAALERPVRGDDNLAELTKLAETVLDRLEARAAKRSAHLRRGARATVRSAPAIDDAEAITRAAAVLPVASTPYTIGVGRDTRTVLFYRTDANDIALYEPSLGSCVARVSGGSDLAVVRVVARKLGFDPATVRLAGKVSAGVALVASVR